MVANVLQISMYLTMSGFLVHVRSQVGQLSLELKPMEEINT